MGKCRDLHSLLVCLAPSPRAIASCVFQDLAPGQSSIDRE